MNRGEDQFEKHISKGLKNFDDSELQLWYEAASVKDKTGDFYLHVIWRGEVKPTKKIHIEVKSSAKKVNAYSDFGNTYKERILIAGVRPERQCYIVTWVGDLNTGQWVVLPPTFINFVFIKAGRATEGSRSITLKKTALKLGEKIKLVTNENTDLLTAVLSAIERNDHRTETGVFWGAEYDLMRCAIWR